MKDTLYSFSLHLGICACRPLLVIGKGAAQAHADSLIRQLVDKARIPVLSTSMGRGVVSDTHPLSVMAARSLALSNSDVVVIFGARYLLHCMAVADSCRRALCMASFALQCT